MATETRYTFQPEDIRRIADAVRAHERRTIHGGGGGFVREAPHRIRHGKTDGTITKGTTGTVSLYKGVTTSGGATTGTDTGLNVTANNMYGDPVPINTWVTVAHDGQTWAIIAMDCA